ncbi:MAG: glycosyltransferase family 4 protein [Ginsengibacter sp.]
MKRLAIITSHPIQYNAPWFKLLAKRKNLAVKVFYTWGQSEKDTKYDPGFAKNVKWDIPLLEGYEYRFVNNISEEPGSHHFKGIYNPTLIKEIEQWNPDAILVFGWNFKSHLKVIRYFKGKNRIIFRGDSTLLDEGISFSLKKNLRRVFLRWVYRHVDKALYVGTANREYYRALGLKNDQLVFAPHAIDNNRFMQDRQHDVRKQLGIPIEEIVFLFAGKFEEKKNPSFLLESFIQSGLKNAHLLMVGNGHLETILKNKVLEQNLDFRRRIHFIDFQNQSKMPEIYQTCDVLVLPSQGPGETWGLAVNEAMASGKAVLVSNKCGCAADLIQEGINGYVFESNNKEDLIKKMNQFSLQKASLRIMGNQSLQIIQDWSFQKICEAIEQSI